MILEVLYNDVAGLFRDDFNMRYLQQCLPGSELVYTDLFAEPRFARENVDVIYLGPMSDKYQQLVIEQLTPYRERLAELVEGGTVLLAFGNALEIFCASIDGEPALGIVDAVAEHHLDRFDRSCLLGTFEDMCIVGFKGQFSDITGNKHPWITVDKGVGQPDDPTHEGIHYRNFFGSYLMGPFLILNPPFTQYLLRVLGADDTLAHTEAVTDAYDARVAEFERKDIGLYKHL